MPEQQELDTIQLLPLPVPKAMVQKSKQKPNSTKNKSSATKSTPEGRRQKMELIANFAVSQKCSETVKPKSKKSFLSRLFCKREKNLEKGSNSEVVEMCVPVEDLKKAMLIQIDCKTGGNNTTNINLRLKPIKSQNASTEKVLNNANTDNRLKTLISSLLARENDGDRQGLLLQNRNNRIPHHEELSESSTTFSSGFLGTSAYFTTNGTTVSHNEDLIQIHDEARQRTTTI